MGRYTSYEQTYEQQHWDSTETLFKRAVGTDVDGLATLMASEFQTEDIMLFITETPSYVGGDTFTLPGDFTEKFAINKRVEAYCGADGMKYAAVASRSYGGGITTVNLSASVLTANLLYVKVVATRDGNYPYGPGYVVARDYGVPSQATLQLALAAIGSLERTLILSPGTWSITSDQTIPANVTLKPERGAILAIATTKTLTINGGLEAGPYQIFSCTGTGKVILGASATKEVFIEWWAFNTIPGTTDMAPALQAAFNALTGGGKIKLLPTTYYLGSQVVNTLWEIHLVGSGKEKTKLVYTKNDGTSALKYSTGINSNMARCVLRDFRIYGFDGAAATDGIGLELVDIVYFVLENLYIEGFKNVGNTGKGIATYGHTNNTFRNVTIAHCNMDVYFGENPNAHAWGIDVDYFRFEECVFVNSTSEDGYNVYFDCNYVNNLMFEGCEFAYAKYGLYKNGGFSPAANSISIRGGRCEYATARVDARFIYFNITSSNLYQLSVRDFYSPYPIELNQYVNFVVLDNVYLGADNPGGTASLITGATVGPITVNNSRITVGTSIGGVTLWKKAATGSVMSDSYSIRSIDTNGYINLTTSISNYAYSGDAFTATAGENLAINNVCYLKTDGKYWKAQANAASTMPGMVLVTATTLANASGVFLKNGFIRNDGGWGGALTVGGLLYASAATAGAITQSAPASSGDQVQVLGYAYAARVVFFDPNLVVAEVP